MSALATGSVMALVLRRLIHGPLIHRVIHSQTRPFSRHEGVVYPVLVESQQECPPFYQRTTSVEVGFGSCMAVAIMMGPSLAYGFASMVAPLGARSIAMIRACLLPARPVCCVEDRCCCPTVDRVPALSLAVLRAVI